MAQQIVCTEHDTDVDVTEDSIHGRQVVSRGFCPEDGGHEIEVVEW